MKGLVPQHVLDLHNSNKKTSKDEFYCLFADISGFTKITQTLMKDGFQGAEVLETKINSLFFEMIEKVHGCNGFVGTFAGDALTVFFERGSDCFECSLHLQQCFEVNQDFKLKVGIAFGEVQTHIFGERKKAFTFYGEPLDLAAQAEKFCEPGQSAYHNSAQAGLLEGLKTREIEQGFHQIMNNRKIGDFSSRSPLTIENDPTEFLLPGVDSLQFEGEFRQVGILFVAFLLNDLSLTDYIEQVLQVCEETGVNLGLIDFGDKGAKLLLFIGAPQAQENYAFKLLSCAKKLSRIDLVSQRMGASLGHVYAGLMGHKDRQTYSILGEKVNLGARLMGLASWGQILCEERIMRKTRDQAAFDLLGKFELKGFSQTTLVYSFDDFLSQTETAIQSKIKFYGREQELKILTDFLTDESQRGLILVSGVSGVGKSCLTRKAIETSKSPTLQLQAHKGESGEFQAAFQSLIEALKAKFSISDQSSWNESEWSDFLDNLELEDRLFFEDSVEYLQSVLGLREFAEEIRFLPPQRFHQILSDYLNQILFHLNKDPGQFLLVDDLQDLDEESQRILARFLECDGKVLATSRQATLESSLQNHLKQEGLLALEKLNPEDLRSWLSSHYKREIDEYLLKYIENTTRGNPFYVEQMLRYLEEESLTQLNKGKLCLSSEGLELPDNLQTIILSRVDRLSQQLKLILHNACILEQPFPIEVLEDMFSRKHSRFDSSFRKLCEKDYLHIIEDLQSIFSHSLIHDTLKQAQLIRQREALHRLAANAWMKWENFSGPKVQNPNFRIAHHLEQGRKESQSANYYYLAARDFHSQYQLQASISCLKKALKWARTHKFKRSCYLELLMILKLVGDQGELNEWVEIVQSDRASSQVDVEVQIALLIYGFLLSKPGQNPKTLRSKIRRLCARSSRSSYFLAKLHLIEASQLQREGQMLSSRRARDTARQFAQESGDTSIQWEINASMASDLMQQGRYQEVGSLIKGWAPRLKIDQLYNYHNVLGRAAFNSGQVNRAYTHYKRCHEVAKKMGNRRLMGYSLGNLSTVYWQRGDYKTALKYGLQDFKIAQENQDAQGLGVASNMVGGLYLDLEEPQRAIEYYQYQWNLSSKHKIAYDQAISAKLLGYCYRLQPWFEKAHCWFEKSKEICRQSQLYYLEYLANYYQALTYCQQKRYQEAHSCLERSRELLRDTVQTRETMAFRVELAWIRCQVQLDKISPEEGIEQTEALFMPYEYAKRDLKLNRAEADYEVFFFSGSELHRKRALKTFQNLFKKRKDGEFKSKAKELEEKVRRL